MYEEKIWFRTDISLILHSETMEQYVATIGFFDGVHRGHQYLIEQTKEMGAKCGMASMIVTFDVHPRKVLHSDYQPQLLTSIEEKLALLEATGADRVETLHFDLDMSRLSAYDFMRHVLRDRLHVRQLLMGYDHKFGHGGGTTEQYLQWGREAGVEVIPAMELQGLKVSSSRIRQLLAEGQVEEANALMGRSYNIKGMVVAGEQVGRKIGFPTANIEPQKDKLLPAVGVYAIRAALPGGGQNDGMLCIGRRPTLKDNGEVTIEAHLFDYDGDLYGKSLGIEVLGKLRDEVRFSSIEELQSQLQQDETDVRQYLTIHP